MDNQPKRRVRKRKQEKIRDKTVAIPMLQGNDFVAPRQEKKKKKEVHSETVVDLQLSSEQIEQIQKPKQDKTLVMTAMPSRKQRKPKQEMSNIWWFVGIAIALILLYIINQNM